jgi:hypothetical protein
MANEIFISLAKEDTDIAKALETALKDLFGSTVKVFHAFSNKISGAPRHGEDWFKWILERLNTCDFAFVLISPISSQNPWIFWEAGVIYGVENAAGKDIQRRIRPIVYGMQDNMIPSPIKDSRFQYIRGDQPNDVDRLFIDVYDQYKSFVQTDEQSEFWNKKDTVIKSYLKQVDNCMRMTTLIKKAYEYMEINISDRDERIKAKNEKAEELGTYVITKGISKEKLTEEDNEALLLALAEAVYIRPEKNDINLLVKIGAKIKRLHVKFRILRSIGRLYDMHCLTKENRPGIQEIFTHFFEDSDERLVKEIERFGIVLIL